MLTKNYASINLNHSSGFLSILALGFVLGIKHAIEPDHVIAVSTIASQSKKLFRASLAVSFLGDRTYSNIIYYSNYPYAIEG